MAKGIPLLTRAGLGLGAIAAGALYNAAVGGHRAHQAIRADRGLPMAGTMRSTRVPMRYKAKRPIRSFNIARRRVGFYRTVVRTTAPVNILAVPVGGFVGNTLDITLSQVYTTDLQAMYRQFRLKKVVAVIYPRVSPANSGIANNYATSVVAACNPDGQAGAPATFSEVSILNGWRSKSLTGAEDKLVFTFYPKALNVINGAAGAAVSAGGYQANPWITLNATGIAVPHKQLVVAAQNAGVALNFDILMHYHFEVR